MQSKSLEGTMVNSGVEQNGRFLRKVLKANAAFSTVSAFATIFFANSIAQWIGLNNATILVGLGIVLLPFAFYVYKVATMETLNSKLVWVIIELDLLWVVGSAILLLSNVVSLTTAGKWSVGLLADVVALFAIFEYVGLRKAQKG